MPCDDRASCGVRPLRILCLAARPRRRPRRRPLPTGIVPFTLSRAQAQQILLDWLHAKEITPDSVAEVNAAE